MAFKPTELYIEDPDYMSLDQLGLDLDTDDGTIFSRALSSQQTMAIPPAFYPNDVFQLIPLYAMTRNELWVWNLIMCSTYGETTIHWTRNVLEGALSAGLVSEEDFERATEQINRYGPDFRHYDTSSDDHFTNSCDGRQRVHLLWDRERHEWMVFWIRCIYNGIHIMKSSSHVPSRRPMSTTRYEFDSDYYRIDLGEMTPSQIENLEPIICDASLAGLGWATQVVAATFEKGLLSVDGFNRVNREIQRVLCAEWMTLTTTAPLDAN